MIDCPRRRVFLGDTPPRRLIAAACICDTPFAQGVQAAVAKDAKDWTLGEQKAVAEDIATKGKASPAYAKAKGHYGRFDNAPKYIDPRQE